MKIFDKASVGLIPSLVSYWTPFQAHQGMDETRVANLWTILGSLEHSSTRTIGAGVNLSSLLPEKKWTQGTKKKNAIDLTRIGTFPRFQRLTSIIIDLF